MARRTGGLLARVGVAWCGALAAGPLAAAAFECQTDVELGENALYLDRKGLNIDDATMQWCATQIQYTWPNVAGSKLSSIRLFKAWDAAWDNSTRLSSWAGLLRYVELQDAKVLLGTPITCDEESDDQAWEWAKELAGLLGPRFIMGLAIGNELELLQFKSTDIIPEGCVDDVFYNGSSTVEGGYVWSKMKRFVSEFDALGAAYQQVPITSVSTGYALGDYLFLEEPNAPMNSLYTLMYNRWGSRMAFTFNFYPYFADGFFDDDGGCTGALAWGNCFDRDCNVPVRVGVARNRIMQLTGDATLLLWIGETGWSSSVSENLKTQMADCSEWATADTYRNYYQGFLDWDLGFTPDQCYYHVQLADTSAGENGCADTSLSFSANVNDIGECRRKCNENGANYMAWYADTLCECYLGCEQSRPASEFETAAVFYECGGDVPVDHAFFFSLRNSISFGDMEYFGLVDSCDAPVCKVVESEDFSTHDYQAFGNPSLKCNPSSSSIVLFDDHSYGAGNCQNKCSVDSRCGFFTLWPTTWTTDDGLDTYWCRLTASCCDTEDAGEDEDGNAFETQIYAKRDVDYDPDSTADCEGTEADASVSARSSSLMVVLIMFRVFWDAC